jgi:predicted nicotinamide N-methyase
MREKHGWREFNIHDNDDDGEEDAYASGLYLFGNMQEKGTEEMMDFSFVVKEKNGKDTSNETVDITLKGFQDYNHSTGMAVWLGSEIMANYLAKNSKLIRNRSVLELGAGLGLAGIVSHRLLASKVVVTDGDTAVLNDYLRFNATQNQNSSPATDLQTSQLIWGNQGRASDSEENPLNEFRKEYARFDVVIACDCTYMPQSTEPFWQTIDALLKPKTTDDESNPGIFLYVMEAATQAPLEDVLKLADKMDFVWTMETMPSIAPEPQQKQNQHEIYTFWRR